MDDQSDDNIRRIYAETMQPLRAHAIARSGGDGPLADDVVQETWLRAVREWRQKGVPANPGGWLATVARNLIVSEFRRSHRVSPLDEEAHSAYLTVEPEADASADPDLEEVVRIALASMPEDARLLQAFYVERNRTSVIAASMRISERAVEGRLRRARARLRQRIEADVAGSRSAPAGWPAFTPASVGKSLMTVVVLPILSVLAIFPASLLLSRLPRRKLAYVRLIAGPILIALAASAHGPPWARAGLVAFGVGLVAWAIWMLRVRDPVEGNATPPAGTLQNLR